MDIYFDRIKPLFDSKKLTVRELAKEIGIPEKKIYQWNNSETNSYNKYFDVIAKYFHVSIEYLKGETDEKNPAPTNEDGLSEKDARLIAWFRSLPEEKQKAILISQDAPEGLV